MSPLEKYRNPSAGASVEWQSPGENRHREERGDVFILCLKVNIITVVSSMSVLVLLEFSC